MISEMTAGYFHDTLAYMLYQYSFVIFSMRFTSMGHNAIKLKRSQIVEWTDWCPEGEFQVCIKENFKSKTNVC
jgi:hypothetical protein